MPLDLEYKLQISLTLDTLESKAESTHYRPRAENKHCRRFPRLDISKIPYQIFSSFPVDLNSIMLNYTNIKIS